MMDEFDVKMNQAMRAQRIADQVQILENRMKKAITEYSSGTLIEETAQVVLELVKYMRAFAEHVS